MPWDGSHLSDLMPPPRPLAAVFERLEVTAVPDEVLARHKLAQLRRYPGSFAYHHQDLLRVGVFGLFMLLLAALFADLGAMITTASRNVWLGVWLDDAYLNEMLLAQIGSSCVLLGCLWALPVTPIRLRAPARWVEEYLDPIEFSGTVPEPIAAVARAIHAEKPAAEFVIGRLIQGTVDLDPYLLVELGVPGVGETYVLGIWEGDRVIARAV